jgi:tRNA modification GTPase
MTEGDTIYALASGAGAAGIAVIRVSGPDAGTALRALLRGPLPKARMATHARLHRPDATVTGGKGAGENHVLDEGLVLWFPAPFSFTGEDVAELHIHGGRACLEAVTLALAAAAPVRPAEPGEFSRRAFENGKMDLTRAEALADLIAAETEAQRRQAMGQLKGALAARYDGWRAQLVGLAGEVEAGIDFADEELPEDLLKGVFPKIGALSDEISVHLADGNRGERLRSGLTAVILGPPNVGKSSLLNRLAGREVAIVATTAGTTRDVIEVHLDLQGMPVTVADTAGLRAAAEAVEEEGVRRARARAESADIKIIVFDARDWPDLDPASKSLIDRDSLVIVNKTDLGDPRSAPTEKLHIGDGDAKTAIYCVSAKTEAGLADAIEALAAMAHARLGPGLSAPLTRARHRQALEDTLSALKRVDRGKAIELNAEDLRLAARALGRITGRVDVEDILDRIFAEFCIGK